jgi:hypothetical protein
MIPGLKGFHQTQFLLRRDASEDARIFSGFNQFFIRQGAGRFLKL